MKTNFLLSLMAVVLACLFGFLMFNIAEGKENDVVCGVVSTISFIATLIPAFGLHFESSRMGVNIRVLSSVFFVLIFVIQFCFACMGISLPYYIIVSGIVLIIYCALFYKIKSIKEL